MSAEYLAVLITALVAAGSAGSWLATKLLERITDRVRYLNNRVDEQEEKLSELEMQLSKLPVEYVLKADFIREIQEMQENFRQINNKLDKLIEKILANSG
jgi:predicted RNase H-like nuclease (RuvC/YqgF family)